MTALDHIPQLGGARPRYTTMREDRRQRRLFWLPVKGGRWRIDWLRTNRGA